MTNVNISLTKDAYGFLKTLKGGKKSFSDVILGFKEQQGGLLRFFGRLKHVNWNEREEDMKKLRDSFNKRLG